MSGSARWRLSLMMWLIFAAQGAFWPLLAVHLSDLGISGRGRGWIFSSIALASIAIPLGAGELVDRRWATQKYMSLVYGLGTAFLVVFALGIVTSVAALFSLFLLYWFLVAPGFGLCNSLAFRHLSNPKDEFGFVRLWGTIGWMAVGWVVSAMIAWSGSGGVGRGVPEAFWIAALFSAITSIYCLTLPHTPPLAGRASLKSPFAAAFELLKTPGTAVYFVTAFGVSLTTPFVFQVMPPYLESIGLSRRWTSAALSMGQIPEAAALAFLPYLLRRFGYRFTLGLGIVAWVTRYASLATDPPLWVALAGIPLHGLGIACFTVGGQVFFDARAATERRAGAQALNMVVTSGIGNFFGCHLGGEIVSRYPGNYPSVFLVPCLINAGLILFFILSFHPRARMTDHEPIGRPRWFTSRYLSRRVMVGTDRIAVEPADG